MVVQNDRVVKAKIGRCFGVTFAESMMIDQRKRAFWWRSLKGTDVVAGEGGKPVQTDDLIELFYLS